MQDVIKLVKISITIDPEKRIFWKKSKLSYKLCKFCIIEK